MDMSNTNYRPLWLKGGIAYAKALENSGYHPVEVGLGERDFYVDVQSNSSITMAEAEKVIEKVKYDNLNYNFKVNSEGISPSNENPSFLRYLIFQFIILILPYSWLGSEELHSLLRSNLRTISLG